MKVHTTLFKWIAQDPVEKYREEWRMQEYYDQNHHFCLQGWLFMIAGCRGSFPAFTENRALFDPNAPRLVRRKTMAHSIWGSATTCCLFRRNNTFIVIDQGGGIDAASEFILAMLAFEEITNATIHVVMTHYHWDHLDGLPRNRLLFQRGITVFFHSPDLKGFHNAHTCELHRVHTMKQCVDETFDGFHFPVTIERLDQIGALREYRTFQPTDTILIDDVVVRTIPLNHPGGCVGIRIETPAPEGDIVWLSDYEPPPLKADPNVVEFIHGKGGTAIVCFDIQYRWEEYQGTLPLGGLQMSRRGWGHGTPEHILPILSELQRRSGYLPPAIRAIHHDPSREDGELRLFTEEMIRCFGREELHLQNFNSAHAGDMYISSGGRILS